MGQSEDFTLRYRIILLKAVVKVIIYWVFEVIGACYS